MAGIKDVAKAAGVSLSTVSYVLSGKRTISRATAAKVMKAIDQLGYVPDASAQRMRGERSSIIALSEPIRKEINQTEFSSYFLQTARQAKLAGYDVLLLSGDGEAVSDIRRVTNNNLADGVVLLDVEEDDERARKANSYGKPCVAIGYPKERRYCACIDVDFDRMGKLASERLYGLGHRKVAFLRNLEENYIRRSGYVLLFRDAFLARSRELGIDIVESEPIEYGTFDPERYVERTFYGNDCPTALVSQADAAILNTVMDALSRTGRDIPNDVSILSCGTYFDAELMRQPISEMPLNPERLCRRVMDLLLGSIAHEADITGMVELIEPEYIDRGSLCSMKQMDDLSLRGGVGVGHTP